MNNLLLYVALGFMLIAAVLTVITDRLLTAVIFAGALSTFAAFGYLLLGAPDVALAEVVVGATLATIIFLVTLKKYRIFTVYLTGPEVSGSFNRIADAINHALRKYELEPHFLCTNEKAEALLSRAGCDLVIDLCENTVVVHRETSGKYVEEIQRALELDGFEVTLEDSLLHSAADYREERL